MQALAGVALLLGRGDPLSLLSLEVAIGDALMLAGVVMAQTLTRPLARRLATSTRLDRDAR